jgi:hypothetical protein
MVTLLARGTVADVDEQLDEEIVTLLAPVDGQLGPHGVGGAGYGDLRRWKRRKTLVAISQKSPCACRLEC